MKKNLPPELQGKPGFGSVWTWTALDADSKLMISWILSDRSQAAADALIGDLKSRTMARLQITSDGFSAYIDAIARSRLLTSETSITPRRSRCTRVVDRSRA